MKLPGSTSASKLEVYLGAERDDADWCVHRPKDCADSGWKSLMICAFVCNKMAAGIST
jgi:hypothetical protein